MVAAGRAGEGAVVQTDDRGVDPLGEGRAQSAHSSAKQATAPSLSTTSEKRRLDPDGPR
jgi:hypothetical protein